MSKLGRFVRRNPLFTAAVVAGTGGGYSFDRWVYDGSDRTQLIVSAVLFVLTFVSVLAPRHLMGRKYGRVYRYWVWYPEDMHLPEHQRRIDYNGYIGKTGDRGDARYQQHMGRSTRYPGPASPWSDLIANPPDARGRRLPETMYESNRCNDRRLRIKERVCIHRNLPLYNYEHNLGNPDRIPIPVAREDRRKRDGARIRAAQVAPSWPLPSTGTAWSN